MLSETRGSQTPNQDVRRWQHFFILLPILLVYLALACYGLGHQSLWKDEILSIRDASSAASMWKKGHGPLYFALLHLWMHLGQSELILRALSVLAGALAVGLFYATGTTLGNRRVTLFGTLLFATSPFVIWYSQEVRYVILMLAAALLAMYTLRRLNARSGFTSWLAYGSALIFAIAAFVANVFVPLAHGLYLLLTASRRRMLVKWLVCVVLVSIPFGVWVSSKLAKTIEVGTTAGQQTVSIDPKKLNRPSANEFSPVILPYTFFAFSTGFSQGPSVHDLHISRSLAAILPHMKTLASLALLFGGLFIVGLIAIWRQPEGGTFLTLSMFIPLSGILVMAFVTNLGFNVRYAAMALPAYLLIVASGIAWFRRLAVQLILLAAVLCSNGVSLANYYNNPYYARADGRAAVKYLMQVHQASDVILLVGSRRAITYYSKGNLPFEELDVRGSTAPSLNEAIRAITQERARLWLIEIRPWEKDPKGQIKAAVDGMYGVSQKKSFPGVTIHRYHVKNKT